MRTWARDHGLLHVNLALFLLFFGGMVATGVQVYSSAQTEHGRAAAGLAEYLTSGDFVEATFENWESEFLQMAVYVLLTAVLFQKGSAESRDPDAPPGEEDAAPDPARPGAPGPVRRGGWQLALYKSSLSLAFFGLFLASAWLHAKGGAEVFSIEQRHHGKPAVTTLEYLATARFWFEALQNWQSESSRSRR